MKIDGREYQWAAARAIVQTWRGLRETAWRTKSSWCAGENNRFSGRIKRYARVGVSVGGVAVGRGRAYFRGDRSAPGRELKVALGGSRDR